MNDSVEAEGATDDIMTPDPDMSSGTTGDMIELEQFQSQPQSAQRMPGPLVSLVCTVCEWANLDFSRGVIWSSHIVIDMICSRAPVFIYFKIA